MIHTALACDGVSMSVRALLLVSCLLAAPRLRAELPLPPVTLYGTITTSTGGAVESGTLEARVARAAGPLVVAGAFKEDQGTMYYVVSLPMETAIGAPGPRNVGAREGDTLTMLLLDGRPLTLRATVPALQAGALLRVDATAATGGGAIRYVRGDCSGDRLLDITDALRTLVFLFVASEPPPCIEACDTDGSGGLEITDPLYLLAYLFLEGNPPPPPPGTDCAVDPGPSNLGCLESPCSAP
jgi:hypothetical protein